MVGMSAFLACHQGHFEGCWSPALDLRLLAEHEEDEDGDDEGDNEEEEEEEDMCLRARQCEKKKDFKTFHPFTTTNKELENKRVSYLQPNLLEQKCFYPVSYPLGKTRYQQYIDYFRCEARPLVNCFRVHELTAQPSTSEHLVL